MDQFEYPIVDVNFDNSIDYKWIKRYPNRVDWTDISINAKLKNKFIRQYKDYVNWLEIGIHQRLNYETLSECGHYLDWNVIVMFQIIPEDLLIQYRDRMTEECWRIYVPRFQKLSTDFIQTYLESFEVYYLIKYQKLSKKQLIWCCQLNMGQCVSKYHRLKPTMICELISELDWKLLIRNPHIDANKFKDHEIITIKPYLNRMFKYEVMRRGRCSELVWTLVHRLWRLERFAKTIQNYWRRAISDPNYIVCKRRLRREFNDLI